jgi:hypothetical protein
MRIMMRVLLILTLLTTLAFGAEGSRSVVLETANLGQPALEKTVSTTSETGFSFRLAGVEMSEKTLSEGTYQEISPITDTPEKFGKTNQVSYPDLPVYSQMVAIPDQAGVVPEIISSSYQIIDNVDVYPFQREPLDSNPDEIIPFTKDEDFYQQDAFYPPEVVHVQEPVIFRDIRMVSAVICPIQYNPAKRQLKIYTNIDWRLSYEGTDARNQKIRHNNYISETFLPMYRAMVPNADEMLATYQPKRGGYLILYPRLIPDSLIQDLARWKHLKGYSVVAVPDSAIAHNSSPTAQQVLSFIQNAYDTWDIPPEFVCILGSIFVTNRITDWPYDGLASDHQYACVDGSDYFADVMVTRMSMPLTLTIMRTTIWKSIIYDKTPYMGDPAYWTRGLSCAGNVSGATTPRLSTLWVREMLLRHGFTQVDTVFYWDGQSDAPGIAAITASLNNGVCITSYRGWGFPSHWGHPAFSVGNLDALQFNNKISPACCPTCGTANFGSQDCFGEHWCTIGSLTSGLKGGPGYFGACGEDTKTRYDNPFMVGYYAGILMEGVHNFASACFLGKMELYDTFPFDRGAGGDVAHFTYEFNPLGEPEFEVRTGIPQTMTVTYAHNIPVGTNMLTVHVVGSDGRPLDSAYVNLLKGYGSAEEVFVGGRTDANGDITLDFSTTSADTMFVTVTAHNYIPHTGFTLVQSQAVAVNVNAIEIDDDNSGNSHGNNDGNVNPSETVEFGVTLRNFGNSTTATNVQATLTSVDPAIVVTVPTQSYGSIAPGATATSGEFAAQFSPDISQGDHYILRLNITSDQGSWSGAVPVDIKNMLFSNRGLTYPDNPNNRLDPGEISQLVISLQNLGQLDGTALSGVLTTSDTAITITNDAAEFGNIAVGATGSNTTSPFTIQAHMDIYPGHNSNFNLELTSSNGSVANMPFSLVIGIVTIFDPVGPDSYGYYLYDNMDGSYAGCPVYDWVEVSPYEGGSGTRVNFQYGTDDDASLINNLPFDIHYYGETYRYMVVSINGFVAFDTTRYDGSHYWACFDNNQIPEPSAPDGLIAPFWDDLEYSGNNGVFQYADNSNHRYILEWKACTHPEAPGHHPETFEMIIYDPAYYPTPTGDCEIVFQYQTVYNDDNDTYNGVKPGLYATVGMQNPDNIDGLEYTFDNFYHPAAAMLAAGRAIKMTTVTGMVTPPTVSYDPSSFIKAAQVGQILHDTLTLSNVGSGVLSYNISVFTDQRLLDGNGGNSDDTQAQNAATPIGYATTDGAKPGDVNQPIYPPMLLSHGGPDNYGNSWIDSDDPGGPTYNWRDITGIGTQIPMTNDDQNLGPFNIGFDYEFYGNTFNQFYVCSNGWISFTSTNNSYSNQSLPNTNAPLNLVAPFWDDLYPPRGGEYWYYSNGNELIISFINVMHISSGGPYTFQIILSSSGSIVYQYQSLDLSLVNSCTIGIQNENGSDGLQVVYNASYLHDQMAILFYPPSHWLLCDLHGGSLFAGQDTTADITFDATELEAGTYTGRISIISNDPHNSSIDIPVSFAVGGTGTPAIVQSPTSYTDTLEQEQSTSFNIMVRNTGDAPLTVGFSSASSWISTNHDLYNVPVGDSLLHSVTLSSVGLTPAIYNGNVITTTNDPGHPTVTLPVQLLVTSPQGISDNDGILPTQFAFSNIYPNPFNSEASFQYALPQGANVTFDIFDIEGRLVRSISCGQVSAGYHTLIWNGANDNGTKTASGLYMVRMIVGDHQFMRKVVMLK